jgi:hypothetical protein
MPVDLPPAVPKYRQCNIEFADHRHYPNDEHLTIGFNGYAQMRLHADCVSVDYVDITGATIFTEAWKVSDGVLQRVS